MSLYIGEDTNNKAILHITSGGTAENIMQTPDPGTNSVFHSNKDYISTARTLCTITAGSKAIPFSNGSTTYHGYYIDIPMNTIFDIVASSLVFSFEIRHTSGSTTMLPEPMALTTAHYYVFTKSDGSGAEGSLSATYPRCFIRGTAVSHVYLHVLNAGYTGFIPLFSGGSTGISISSSEMTINGVNLYTYGYLSRMAVNSVDPTVTLNNGGSVQFVNTELPNDSISITSDSTNTAIKKGVHSIFDSSIGNQKIFYDSLTTVNIPARTLTQGTYSTTLLINVVPGDIFIVYRPYINNTDTVTSPTLIIEYSTSEVITRKLSDMHVGLIVQESIVVTGTSLVYKQKMLLSGSIPYYGGEVKCIRLTT